MVVGRDTSATYAVIWRAENPLFDGENEFPPSLLASTPPRSVAISTRLEFVGSTYTSLMITSAPVVRCQVAPESTVLHNPSVVPAKTMFRFLGSCIKTLVRRAVEGIP